MEMPVWGPVLEILVGKMRNGVTVGGGGVNTAFVDTLLPYGTNSKILEQLSHPFSGGRLCSSPRSGP